MRKNIVSRILLQQNEALQFSSYVVDGTGYSRDEVLNCVHQYVCAKFLLDPSESCEESLYTLAEKSIEKAISSGIKVSAESESVMNCGTAGTAAIKISLLLMALRRDFHAELSFESLGKARHTRDLGMLVAEHYHDRIKE